MKDLQPIQPGDVEAAAANAEALESWINFRPSTSIELGVEKFIGGIDNIILEYRSLLYFRQCQPSPRYFFR